MTTADALSGTELVEVEEPLFSPDEQLAPAGFLAGCFGLTRDAYTLDLRMCTAWCLQHELHLFTARAPTSSASAATWKPQAGLGRRSRAGCAPSPGFYRYTVEEELLEHSPQRRCVDPGWTTSPTRSVWTATKSARC
jgi:hypothetical protein